MKTFYRKAVSLCLFLAVMVMIIGIATAEEAVGIRGPVYDGRMIESILATGSDGTVIMDASQFAAFFYNINNDETIESLSITKK